MVYLLAELRSAEQGPVHEIGSRARVLEADGDRLTLAVGYGRFESVVTCSRALVARHATHSPRGEPCAPTAGRRHRRDQRTTRRRFPSREAPHGPARSCPPHAERPQHRVGLKELHLVVLNDLDEIAPGIPEVSPRPGSTSHACASTRPRGRGTSSTTSPKWR